MTVRATVEIFGQRLGLRADGDTVHLQTLARYVDQKMRELADMSSTVDTVKIAVLTALNIADELFQERAGESSSMDPALEETAERLVLKIERALAEGPAEEILLGEDDETDVS